MALRLSRRLLSQNSSVPYQPRSTVIKNTIFATVLFGISGGVYGYMVKQTQDVVKLGDDFDELAHTALKNGLPDVERPPLK